MLVDEWTGREVDAADAEVDRRRLEDAHLAWKHVVGVQQHRAEIASLQDDKLPVQYNACGISYYLTSTRVV